MTGLGPFHSYTTLSTAERVDARTLLSADERRRWHCQGMEIRDLIRVARRKAGLSQAALADRLGINKSAVAQWETGDTKPTNENMAALKLEIGFDPGFLVAEGAPYAGELIEDPDELALLHYWRSLGDVKQEAFTDLLRIGQKAPVRKSV